MKKKPLLLISLISWMLFFGIISSTARADITSWTWLGCAYNGYDSFYRTTVYAYQEKSTATFSVTVYNDFVNGKPVNISALKIGMDWGQNYTSSMTSSSAPYVIPWHESRVIPIVFTVPNLTQVSSQAQYSYTIYLEHVNATTGPQKVTSLKQFVGTNFVVYSSDQINAQQTKQIIQQMQLTTSPSSLNSTKAKLLWTEAENETFVAGLLYAQGNFYDAKTHYGTALSLLNQALAAEEAKGGGFDDAQVALLQAQAKSFEATANYMNGLSSMWILIGVAAVLFAIGYIIRGFGSLRKPAAAAA
jgi:hypothetical protein